jgi:hypothetical protein
MQDSGEVRLRARAASGLEILLTNGQPGRASDTKRSIEVGAKLLTSAKCFPLNLHRHHRDRAHVIVAHRTRLPVVPDNFYTAPIDLADCAAIRRAVCPTNAVASFEKSGLVAGHHQ